MSAAADFARVSLSAYAIHQNHGYQVAPHHKRIARALERVASGECKRLIVCMPPRHGKTMLASEFFPAWYLGKNPSHQVIAATYAQQYANDIGRKVRNQLLDAKHREVFPACRIRVDSRSATRFNTSAGGAYYAVGAGGPITGRGAHLLLIDDPIKGAAQADSDVERRKLREWYTSVAYTRLMPGGAVVIIQTRWHEDDLAGWLLREHADEGWEVLSLPALSDEGAALWPEAYPAERLLAIKRQVGSRVWEALYQQRPSPAEGGMFKRAWWQYYRELPAEADQVVGSWDLTFKNKATSDWVVGQVWARCGARKYLVDQVRGRMNFPETIAAIKAFVAKWPQARPILIEDAANGPAVIATLASIIPGIVAVTPIGSKVARAAACTATVEAGNVYLPEGAEWVGDFVEEHAAFPNGAHDDQVDAMSQALPRLDAGAVVDGTIVEHYDPVNISDY